MATGLPSRADLEALSKEALVELALDALQRRESPLTAPAVPQIVPTIVGSLDHHLENKRKREEDEEEEVKAEGGRLTVRLVSPTRTRPHFRFGRLADSKAPLSNLFVLVILSYIYYLSGFWKIEA